MLFSYGPLPLSLVGLSGQQGGHPESPIPRASTVGSEPWPTDTVLSLPPQVVLWQDH